MDIGVNHEMVSPAKNRTKLKADTFKTYINLKYSGLTTNRCLALYNILDTVATTIAIVIYTTSAI